MRANVSAQVPTLLQIEVLLKCNTQAKFVTGVFHYYVLTESDWSVMSSLYTYVVDSSVLMY